MARFVPLELDLIDQGRFVEDINAELRTIQAGLVRYARKYKGNAVKTKAEIQMKIVLQYEGQSEDDFSIKTTMSKKVPCRPPTTTLALADDEQDGTPLLFVKRSGSTKDHPTQQLLCTDDGRPIDVETGAVKEE